MGILGTVDEADSYVQSGGTCASTLASHQHFAHIPLMASAASHEVQSPTRYKIDRITQITAQRCQARLPHRSARAHSSQRVTLAGVATTSAEAIWTEPRFS